MIRLRFKNPIGITVTSDAKLKQFFARWLLCMLLVPGLCYPQALPSLMQKAVSGVMQNRMAARGFAANDPRWAATFSGAGSSIGGAAAAAAVVTLAGVTAPAWLTVAATAALGTVFAAGISLAVDSAIKWAMSPDGTTKISTPGAAYNPLVVGQPYWTNAGTVVVMSAEWGAIIRYRLDWLRANDVRAGMTWEIGPCVASNSTTYTCEMQTVDANGYRTNSGNYSAVLAPGKTAANACAGGSVYVVGTGCVGVSVRDPVVDTKTAQQAIQSLTASQLAQPVNPQLLAQIADAGWRTASAQPGYQGIPYDASNPVTQADATAWQQANPQSWPTVADVVKPMPAPTGGTKADPFVIPTPSAPPTTDPGDGGTTPPSTETKFDWTMPGSTESVSKVAAPVSFTPTLFASPQGCPVAIPFTLYGQQFGLSYEPFCDLMRMVAPIFIALGALSAALIFASSLK